MDFFKYIFFSEYSAGRLPTLILSLIIAFFLLFHPGKSKQSKIAGFYFLIISIFHFGYFLNYSLHHPLGSIGYYIVAISPFGLVLHIQFAYLFPKDHIPKERKIVLFVTLFLSILAFLEYFIFAIQSPIGIYSIGYGSIYVSKLVPIAIIVFLIWAMIVFVRKTLYHSMIFHAREQRHWKDLVQPGGKEAVSTRNFSLLTIMELLNVVFITSEIFFRSFSYRSLLIWMNFIFFIIYSLYVILYLRHYSGSTPVSFKILSFSLITSLVLVMIAGNQQIINARKFYQKQIGNSLETLSFIEISSKKMPNQLLFLLLIQEDNKREIVYQKNSKTNIPVKLNLWKVSPDLNEYYEKKQHLNFYELKSMIGKELYIRIPGHNVQFYPFLRHGQLYGAGFDFIYYRKFIHGYVKSIFTLYLYVVIINLIFFPILLSRIFSQPLRELITSLYQKNDILLLKPSKKNIKNEIEILNETLIQVNEDLENKKQIEKEYHLLKEQIESEKSEELVEPQEPKDVQDNKPLSEETIRKVQEVESYLKENFNYELSREGLAAMVHLSPGRLGKYFKQHTGLKISDYTNKLRIQKASEMLKNSNKTILEIAFEVGFESLRTFNRVFSQEKGSNPSYFRQKDLT